MKLIKLSESGSGERIIHILEDREEWAIKGALAANRPLLIRGEPGIGKTQLAWAAAEMLKRPLVAMTLDSNTEARDLMWTFDAVQRLAEAQVAATHASIRKKFETKSPYRNLFDLVQFGGLLTGTQHPSKLDPASKHRKSPMLGNPRMAS